MVDDALTVAQKELALQTIHVRKSELNLDPGFDPLVPPTESLRQSFHGVESIRIDEFTDDDNDKTFGYDYKFTFVSGIRLVPESKADKEDSELIYFELTASFEARYFSEIELSQESVAAFADKNVGFNVWPFWREYAQSTSMRAGMSPPIEIPFIYHVSNSIVREGNQVPNLEKTTVDSDS